MYYFKSQTGNIVSNDAIMAHFGWFMKLPSGSIKQWANLEKLFLA